MNTYEMFAISYFLTDYNIDKSFEEIICTLAAGNLDEITICETYKDYSLNWIIDNIINLKDDLQIIFPNRE